MKKTIIIGIILLSLIIYEGIQYTKLNDDRKEYESVYHKYSELTTEIAKYEQMKNDIIVVSNKNQSIQEKVDELNKKIDELNNEINNYKTKIATLNSELSK